MNNRVVILEGPDLCGKTTLAESLVSEHGFLRIPVGPPEPDQDVFKTYTDLLIHALTLDQHVVFDRLHIGETIYGPIFRKQDKLGPDGLVLLNRLINARDVKVVMCLATWEHVERNFLQRGDKFVGSIDRLKLIWDKYEDYCYQKASIVYDYVHHSVTDLKNEIFEPGRTLPAGCTGSANAKFLIVGERVNEKVLQHDLPFHHRGNSSDFLNQAIAQLNLSESTFAFTNAFPITSQQPRNLSKVIMRMPSIKRAIALGHQAAAVCQQQNIRYDLIAHPSHVKRFGTYTVNQYASLLKEKMK